MNTLKKFISYYRPYRAVFYFDLFCAAVISVVDLAYPQLLRSLTKTLFTGNKSAILGALPWLFLILLMMYTIQSLCKYYVTCQGHIMGAKMERDMRKQLFEHYEKLSFSYYSTHNSGQMMSKLVSDLFDISELAHHGPENLFISLVKIIGSFVFLFLINQKLALPLLLLVILMILFSIRQNKKMQQTFLENRIRIGDINASLQDTLSGIRVVQSFANEDTELHKFNHSNEAFLESKKDNYRCMGTFMSSNLFFQGMMYLTTLIYGGYLIAMGQMQAADLAMYALYIGIFISPIQILVELVEMLQKGLSGFRRYLEVVETEPEIQDKEGAIDLKNVKGDVCYDNVSFHYSDDNKTVLSQVSIHIPAGKSVALVGPSGGGKTTICSLLPRFYDVTAGKVTIDGKDVRDLTLKSLRNQIGMVQQDVYLFDGTIRENIAYGKPDATDEEIKEAARRANMDDFIMQLPKQYDTYVGEKGTRLSGGQKQRISIARVFLKNPPILILDEATSALDNESERYIQKSLEELAKNRTTITIAHRLSTINVPTKSLSSPKMALPSAVHTKLYLQKTAFTPVITIYNYAVCFVCRFALAKASPRQTKQAANNTSIPIYLHSKSGEL
jgi:ATP-binding cassette subfamily B protein